MAAHDIEPELTQPVPRPTQRRGGAAAGCAIWFIRLFLLPHTLGGIALLVAAVCASIGWVGVWTSGTDLEGRITRKSEAKQRKSTRKTYTLHYAYALDGREYQDQTTVSKEEYAARQEGQAISLRVWPWAPRMHWVQLPGAWPFGAVLGYWAGALFWNGVMFLFVWAVWIRPWQQWRLVRWGVPTLGIVRDVKRTPMKRGYNYTVHYEYVCAPVDYEPEKLLTSSVSSHTAEASAIKKGDVLTVLHHPKRPQRSVLYKLADFEATGAPAPGPEGPG